MGQRDFTLVTDVSIGTAASSLFKFMFEFLTKTRMQILSVFFHPAYFTICILMNWISMYPIITVYVIIWIFLKPSAHLYPLRFIQHITIMSCAASLFHCSECSKQAYPSLTEW